MSTLQTTILKHPDAGSNNIQFDSSGQVGIGTSPGRTLDVSGSIRSGGSTNPFIALNDNTTEAYFEIVSSVTRLSSGTSQPLAFRIASNEAARFDGAGRLLVGSQNNYFDNAYLQVSGNNSSNYIAQINESASDVNGARWNQIHWIGTQSGGERSSLAAIQAAHDGALDDQRGRIQVLINDGDDGNSPEEVLRIDSSGRVQINTTAPHSNEHLRVHGQIVTSSLAATTGSGYLQLPRQGFGNILEIAVPAGNHNSGSNANNYDLPGMPSSLSSDASIKSYLICIKTYGNANDAVVTTRLLTVWGNSTSNIQLDAIGGRVVGVNPMLSITRVDPGSNLPHQIRVAGNNNARIQTFSAIKLCE